MWTIWCQLLTSVVEGVWFSAPILTDALASETSLVYRLRSFSRAGGVLAQVTLAYAWGDP